MTRGSKRPWEDSLNDDFPKHSTKHHKYSNDANDDAVFSLGSTNEDDLLADPEIIDLRDTSPGRTTSHYFACPEQLPPIKTLPIQMPPPRPLKTERLPLSAVATATPQFPGFRSVLDLARENPHAFVNRPQAANMIDDMFGETPLLTPEVPSPPPDRTPSSMSATQSPSKISRSVSSISFPPIFQAHTDLSYMAQSEIDLLRLPPPAPLPFRFEVAPTPPPINNFQTVAAKVNGIGTADQPVILSSSSPACSPLPESKVLSPAPEIPQHFEVPEENLAAAEEDTKETENIRNIALEEHLAAAEEDIMETENIRKRALEEQLATMDFAQQPYQIKTKMLPHQLQALAWMRKKESPMLPTYGSKTIVQFWKAASNGQYFNIASKERTNPSEPPVLYSGGVLADDMGLGKTLQMISLVVSDTKSGPTLIVCPLSVMSNWQQQFKQHLRNDSQLRVLIFHTKAKKLREADLKEYDVIITTYTKIAMEYEGVRILTNISWRRVILDEGHIIRNANTKSAKAACELQTHSRWVVTGTPIINRVDDLRSIAKFVGIHEFLQRRETFLSMMNKSRLCQSFVADLCLRRTKDMKFVNLKLPPKTENVELISFSEEERADYEILLNNAREAARRFFRNDKDALWSTVLERLLRLRQYCDHWTLSAGKPKDDDDFSDASGSPSGGKSPSAYLKGLVKARELCHVCWDSLSPSNEPVLTPCEHGFCKPCLMQASRDGRLYCPRCQNIFDESEIVEATFNTDEITNETSMDGGDGDGDDDDDDDGVIYKQSSKTIVLYKLIRSTLADPRAKIVIFSQWTSFLNIVQAQLVEFGIKVTRLDGTMPGEARDASIKAIQTDPNTRVMLASLRTAGVGITLTSANVVILADSWWAPAIEEQAIDRIHRLGQMRPTTVYRLVIKDTVEQGVIAIQDEKRRLFGEAFQESFKILTANDAQDMVRRLLSN